MLIKIKNMAQLRPNLYSPGIYNPVVQSNPKIDLYNRGILPDRISAAYRRRQKKTIDKQPYIDRIQGPIQNPKMTPSAMQMMGQGKNKSKVRAPFNIGNASKTIAFFNDVGMSAKKAPKMVKGTLAKMGPKSVAREPTFNKKIGRYVK
jgi:hypothetical protein